MKPRCEARIGGRRCPRLARGKGYESKMTASKPDWSLLVRHRMCLRCGSIFLDVTRMIERALGGEP